MKGLKEYEYGKLFLLSIFIFALSCLAYHGVTGKPHISIRNGEVQGLDMNGKEWATIEIEYMILKGVETYKNSKK